MSSEEEVNAQSVQETNVGTSGESSGPTVRETIGTIQEVITNPRKSLKDVKEHPEKIFNAIRSVKSEVRKVGSYAKDEVNSKHSAKSPSRSKCERNELIITWVVNILLAVVSCWIITIIMSTTLRTFHRFIIPVTFMFGLMMGCLRYNIEMWSIKHIYDIVEDSRITVQDCFKKTQ
ncbi:hypothetical protein SNEBB_002198 [Seison nebaliae]|nr:hypothetical protein SNEBB_002198 [Seison nebaliae]